MKQFKIQFYFLSILLVLNLSGCDPDIATGVEDSDGTGTVETDSGISADAAAVAADTAALDESDFTFASGDSRTDVTGDFTVPTSGDSGTIITWTEKQDTGDNVSVNAGTVTVTRPAAGSSDAEVILTAAVSMGSESATVDFTFTINHIPDDEALAFAVNSLTFADFIFAGIENENTVKSSFTLPLTDANSNAITWTETTDSTNNISISGNTVTVTRPAKFYEHASVTITAALTFGSSSDTKDFTILILADYMSGVHFSTNVSSFTYETPAENSAARIFRLAEDSETNSVAIVGNYAYVAHEYGPAGDPVYVFDISNPADPKAVCYFDLNASFYNITASGNYLYAVWNRQIFPIDVSDPVNPEVMRPVEIASTELTSVLDLYIDGSTLYYTGAYSYNTSTRVGAIDISNPAVPVIMDYILFSGRPYRMTCSNGYVYIANGYTADASLSIVDGTDPMDLKQIYLGDLDDNLSYTTGISIDGDYLYVSDDGYQIDVVNITDPAAPVYVKTVEPSGTRSLGILLVSGNSLYGVNRGDSSVLRLDISGTPDITEKTKVVYGGDLTGSNVTGTDFEVNGGYLYVTGVYNPTSNDIWNGFAVMPDN